MSLREEIELLRDQTLAALDGAWDYYSDSKNVWRAFQLLVKEGHKFNFTNIETGAQVDEAALASRSQPYVTRDLGNYALQEFTSVFEDFFIGLLRLWLVEYPDSLGRKQIAVERVLQTPDKDALIEEIVDRELNELRYKRVSDWFADLGRLVHIKPPPTPDRIEQLAEIKASRDICVHARGIANSIYRDKSGNHARFQAGERIENHEQYLQSSWNFLKQFVEELSASVLLKVASGP